MTTLVGTQTNIADALRELTELDYDAAEAYKAAIDRLESQEYKNSLIDMMEDHNRHIRELSATLTAHNEEAPTGPSTKQWLTKGKVVISSIVGDEAILAAMLSNEGDTNTAYERMLERDDLWEDVKDVIKRGREDELRHKKWLESI